MPRTGNTSVSVFDVDYLRELATDYAAKQEAYLAAAYGSGVHRFTPETEALKRDFGDARIVLAHMTAVTLLGRDALHTYDDIVNQTRQSVARAG